VTSHTAGGGMHSHHASLSPPLYHTHAHARTTRSVDDATNNMNVSMQVVGDAAAADAGTDDAAGGRRSVNKRQPRRRRRSQLPDRETSLSWRSGVSSATRRH